MAEVRSAYRKPGGEARVVRELVFDHLPPAVRERLVVSLARGGAPAPLSSAAGGRLTMPAWGWAGLSVVLGFAEVVVWFASFGDRVDDPVLSPLALALGHAVALSGMAFAAVMAARVARGREGAPVGSGRYLFELDLVEVEGRRVRVTALDSLRRIDVVASRKVRKKKGIVLHFADGHEVAMGEQEEAEELAASALAAVRAARELVLTEDQGHVERIDPFFDLRVGDDWSSATGEAGARGRPLYVRAPIAAVIAACVVGGAAVGGGMWEVGRRRLVVLDEARFAAAQGKPAALKRYVESGGRRAKEAEDLWFEAKRGDARVMGEVMEKGGRHAAAAKVSLQASTDVEALVEVMRLQHAGAATADERLFELARKADTSGGYALYIRYAGRRSKEAEALQYEAAFAAAKRAAETAGVLFDHLKQYGAGAHSDEARGLLRKLYDEAIERWVREEKPDEKKRRFVEALASGMIARADPLVNLEVKVSVDASIEAADVAHATREGALYRPVRAHLRNVERLREPVDRQVADWLMAILPRGMARFTITKDDAKEVSGRPTIEVTCVAVADGTLKTEEGATFTAVRFGLTFRAGTAEEPEQLAWTDKTAAPDTSEWSAMVKEASTGGANQDVVAERVYERMLALGELQVQARVGDHL